jgi:hypothetical protein
VSRTGNKSKVPDRFLFSALFPLANPAAAKTVLVENQASKNLDTPLRMLNN